MPKIAYFAVVLLVVLFLFIASAASTMGSQDEIITAEAFVPSASTAVALSYSNIPNAIYSSYPEVTVGTGNNLTMEGKDYDFHPNNGTIIAKSGGSLDGASNAKITYRYTQQNQWTSTMTDIYGGLSTGLLPGMLLMIVVSLIFLTFKNLTS